MAGSTSPALLCMLALLVLAKAGEDAGALQRPVGARGCVYRGAARLRGGAGGSVGSAEKEPALAASLMSAEPEFIASDDSLIVAAGGARAVSNTETEGARAGAMPLRARPQGPKAASKQSPPAAPAKPHEGSSSAGAPDAYEQVGDTHAGNPQPQRWKEPLPIPSGAPGFELWRWLQARNMGAEFYYADGEGQEAVTHDERSGPDNGSWLARMEKAQANVKEPTDSPYNFDALFGEDKTQYFPDVATENLWWSCVDGDIEATRAALGAGAQVNFTHAKYHRRTPLHYAASLGEVDDTAVRMLIAAGADVNAEDEAECRPLHMAAESWDPDKVRALVEAGAEKNHTNGHGYTPLQVARALYDACKDPKLAPNPDYDPKWETEMMALLAFEGSVDYPTLWPLHSGEIAAASKGAAPESETKREREIPVAKGRGA